MWPLDRWLLASKSTDSCFCRCCLRPVLAQLRIAGSLIGSVFLWNGLYNCLYFVLPAETIAGWLGDTDNITPARGVGLQQMLAC